MVSVNKKQESRIPSTCIRSLVKQLASSRSTNDSNLTMSPQDKPPEDSSKSGDCSSKGGKTQTHKKQVRRRLHTSRPYQERLLNMAEARREIVTALKQHRAAMRQASERERQQTQTQIPVSPLQAQTLLLTEQTSSSSSSSSSRLNVIAAADYVVDPFSSYVHPPPPPQPPDTFPWTIPANPPLNLVLPNQPLGLNLNFQDFNDIIQTSPSSSSSICTNNNPPIYSSPSSSSSPLEAVMMSPTLPSSSFTAAGDAGFHHRLGEEEMVRMRSIGENHQMEWNDTVNLVTSAWWFEFMKTQPPAEMKSEIENDVFRPFDDVMEFPSWLNPSEDFDFFQPDIGDYSSPDDPGLSCMEIGEIEGMDGDWLS